MKKREFLKNAGIIGAGIVLSPIMACGPKKMVSLTTITDVKTSPEVTAMPITNFVLPELGFATNALEPAIDALTMEIHHGKHHAGYVQNINKVLDGKPFNTSAFSLEEICKSVTDKDTAVRNNGGGHWNHSMFWKWITPGGSKAMDGSLMKAIVATFGSFEEFQKQFIESAKTRFGSGWTWLSVDAEKKLFISSTPNQDNPLMQNLVEKSGTPILGIDVWEHAYYLHYQNRRPDYITAFMGIVNWDVVGKFYLKAVGKS